MNFSNVENLSTDFKLIFHEEEGIELLQKLEKFVTCVDKLATPKPKFTNDFYNFGTLKAYQITKEMVTYSKNLLKNPSFASCLDILPSNSATVASLSTHCSLLMIILLFCVRLCLT